MKPVDYSPAMVADMETALAKIPDGVRYNLYPEEGQQWCIARHYVGTQYRSLAFLGEGWIDEIKLAMNAPLWLQAQAREIARLQAWQKRAVNYLQLMRDFTPLTLEEGTEFAGFLEEVAEDEE